MTRSLPGRMIAQSANVPLPTSNPPFQITPSATQFTMDVLVEEPEVSASANTSAAAVPLPRPRAERKQMEFLDTSQASTRDTSSREPLQISNDSYGRLPRRRAADPAIILQIETIVGQMFDSLQKQEDSISISLRTKRAPNPSSSQTSARSSKDYYKISFPGRSPQEAKRFSRAALVEAVCNRTSSMLICSPAIVLRILELIHEALVADIVISKRYGRNEPRTATISEAMVIMGATETSTTRIPNFSSRRRS